MDALIKNGIALKGRDTAIYPGPNFTEFKEAIRTAMISTFLGFGGMYREDVDIHDDFWL